MTKAEMDLLIREVNIPMYNILLRIRQRGGFFEHKSYV